MIGRPARALIVAPHPDDEAIGCYGLVRRLRAARVPVWIVVVTDGGASHPGSTRWPRPRLAALRAAETRRAAARMGVPAGRIAFLRLADGALSADPGAARTIRRALAPLHRGGLLVGPCRQDDHADHRAAARHLAALHLPAVRRLAYRVWPQASRDGFARPLAVDAVRKRSVVRCYRSQCGAITDDPAGFALTQRQIARFTGPREWYARG